MTLSHREIGLSWIFVLTAGIVVWPPRAVYWEEVAAVIGERFTLVVVGLVAIALGVGFLWGTGVRFRSFIIGAVAAYVSGMAGVEFALTPNSPVHLVLYGGLLGCFLFGAALWSAHNAQWRFALSAAN